MPIAYCTECNWTRRVDDATDELDRAMIDHYAETGHSPIERVDRESLEDEIEAERLSGTVRIDRERAFDTDSDSDSESEAE